MPHILADRVLESSTSSGTGAFTMAGAVLGFRAFSAVCAVSDTVPYFIEAVDSAGRPTGDWEFGLGTYSAANQLTRTTIRGSSNGGLAVSFPAGTKLVGLGVNAPNSAQTRAEWRSALGFSPIGESIATSADAAAVLTLLGISTSQLVPPGAVEQFAMSSAPAGWLKANGAAVSRATYAALFAAIGTTFGAGDGSTTFNLPDLRGEFIRGWDDGRGVDASRAFGSAQASQMSAHTHTYTGGIVGLGYNSGAAANGTGTSNTGSAGGTTNSSETRPRNIALLFCIKF